jgi:hypothetical protein
VADDPVVQIEFLQSHDLGEGPLAQPVQQVVSALIEPQRREVVVRRAQPDVLASYSQAGGSRR